MGGDRKSVGDWGKQSAGGLNEFPVKFEGET